MEYSKNGVLAFGVAAAQFGATGTLLGLSYKAVVSLASSQLSSFNNPIPPLLRPFAGLFPGLHGGSGS